MKIDNVLMTFFSAFLVFLRLAFCWLSGYCEVLAIDELDVASEIPTEPEIDCKVSPYACSRLGREGQREF